MPGKLVLGNLRTFPDITQSPGMISRSDKRITKEKYVTSCNLQQRSNDDKQRL